MDFVRLGKPQGDPSSAANAVASGAAREYAPNMVTKRLVYRNIPWLSCLFVTLLGCGATASPHYVPPTLPPMDPDQPLASATSPKPAPKNDASTALPSVPTSAPVANGSEKEPGRLGGPCPPPSDVVRRMLANALEMETKTTDPEPHRAIAEAVRIRLDEVFQHGCFRRLDDDHLLEAVAEMAPNPKDFTERLGLYNRGDLGILASYGTYGGGWVGQYRWHQGMIRTSILATGEQGDLDKQLMTLSAKLTKLPNYAEPILLLANSHPWMSSCWRQMRIRILAPSGDPIHPKALLDKPLSGRWCEGIKIDTNGNSVTFTYDAWGGPWSMALVQRPYAQTYTYDGTNLVEHFGFPPRLEDLPEEWLMREWSFSQEATVESARERLQPLHAKMHADLVAYQRKRVSDSNNEFSQELFPVSATERRIAMYCTVRETNNKPCKEWPKPVDVFIELKDGHWYVKDVVPRSK